MGRNANFSGKGFAENTFNVTAMSQAEFDEWVKEVKETAEPITEEKFNELLKPGHLGQLTFTGTHLDSHQLQKMNMLDIIMDQMKMKKFYR